MEGPPGDRRETHNDQEHTECSGPRRASVVGRQAGTGAVAGDEDSTEPTAKTTASVEPDDGVPAVRVATVNQPASRKAAHIVPAGAPAASSRLPATKSAAAPHNHALRSLSQRPPLTPSSNTNHTPAARMIPTAALSLIPVRSPAVHCLP